MQSATGSIVYVDHVPNGKESGCVCPSCGAGLLAKNAGTKKVHHFAHAPNADRPGDCEGWLHGTAKHLLYQRVKNALIQNEPMPISWRCSVCCCNHQGDLLKRVAAAHMETFIKAGGIQPDIYLEWDGVPAKLIEVVDTHIPSSPVHQFCQTNELPLLIFSVADAEDLERVILAPTLQPETYYVNGCRCPLCPRCGAVRTCTDTHKYCALCETCVEDQMGQFGGIGDHVHCGDCKEVMAYVRGHARHYCCYAAKRYGIPVCRDKDRFSHWHCNHCGKRITARNRYGAYWETCWDCHRVVGERTLAEW